MNTAMNIEDTQEKSDREESGVDVSKPAKTGRSWVRWGMGLLALATGVAVLYVILAVTAPSLNEEELARTRNLQINGDRPDQQEQTAGESTPTLINSVTEIEAPPRGDQEKRVIVTPESGRICDLFDTAPPSQTAHPLDTAIDVALLGLQHVRDDVDDYTATLVKRERVRGKLLNEEFSHVKIRSEVKEEDKIVRPFSAYIKLLAPESIAGSESTWIEGHNKNRMVAHGSGVARMLKLNLKPTHSLAMRRNRYPITEIGIEMLAFRMLEKGLQARESKDITVTIDRAARIDGRLCTRITIVLSEKLDGLMFHHAEIFIDEEYNLPVRYASYSWPLVPGGDKVLEEEYTYRDLEINVGLSDKDFDPDNPDYDYP